MGGYNPRPDGRGFGTKRGVVPNTPRMAVHTIKKGLDLPIIGAPKQSISDAPAVHRVAVMADDYVGMKPKMAVRVGDTVKRGQLLFEDRKCEGVRYTALGAGKIAAVNRGDFRALQSVVIELSPDEVANDPQSDSFQRFESFKGKTIEALERQEVVNLLVESGLWTALRARPFGRVPSPNDAAPEALFVTASDSEPLAPSIDVILEGRESDFELGLTVLSKLTEGKTYLCKMAGSKISASVSGVQVEEFKGPHPAGRVGYHIHTLTPVHRGRTVWHIGAQDVLAVAELFRSGKLDLRRVVALSGPQVNEPRLLRTRLGASIDEVIAGELKKGENRIVSGSVLSGRVSAGEIHGYLGRYHQQIAVLREGREREFLGWLTPGQERFSVSNAYLSALSRGTRKFAFTANQMGSKRHMVPIGMYEQVFPFDMMPTFLLRALLSKDTVRAEELGVLELDVEDMDLCTFVCPGKQNYCTALRENLEQIRSEG